MEPDLDRIVDFESGGGLFPQFGANWRDCFAAARQLKEGIVGSEIARPRIAFWMMDPMSFCAAFLALCRSDLDLFFYNDYWGTKEINAADKKCEPHWVVGRCKEGRFDCSRRESGEGERAPQREGMRVAIPTGGTSGRVRFALHDWRAIAVAAYGLQSHMECDAMSSHCVLPLYHVSGFMQLARSLMTVGTLVFGTSDSFAETHRLFVERVGAGRFASLVPTQLRRLMESADGASLLREYDAIFVGGAPVSAGLLEFCRDEKIPLALAYGMSETAAQVATLRPEAFLRGESGVGRALPHAKIDIVGQESGEPLPAGETGRVRIQSRSLFLGYYGEGDREQGAIVASDLGRLDERGGLELLGRSDGVINTGGEKVNPREVEICLENTNLLRDVAVFGVDDDEWGSKVAAVYEPKGAFVSEQALQDAVVRELAAFKAPKIWFRVDRVPRNAAGKLMLESLIEQRCD